MEKIGHKRKHRMGLESCFFKEGFTMFTLILIVLLIFLFLPIQKLQQSEHPSSKQKVEFSKGTVRHEWV
jgi:hypothetical protein